MKRTNLASLLALAVSTAMLPAYAGSLIVSGEAAFKSAPAPASNMAAPIIGAASANSPAMGVVAAKAEIKPPAPIAKKWQVDVKDITLANTFARWATDANQKIRWDADKHVLVEAPDILTGSFEDVVAQVLSSPGISQGTYPLEVCFYPNNPPLARVTRKGEQGKECK